MASTENNIISHPPHYCYSKKARQFLEFEIEALENERLEE